MRSNKKEKKTLKFYFLILLITKMTKCCNKTILEFFFK